MKQLVLTFLLLGSIAKADIVCKGDTQLGPATITIVNDTVTVVGAALGNPVVFKNVDNVYDGHMTSLITAKGLAISYENWFGCIHNARITTDFRSHEDGGVGYIQSILVSQCSGGTTRDDICHVK